MTYSCMGFISKMDWKRLWIIIGFIWFWITGSVRRLYDVL